MNENDAFVYVAAHLRGRGIPVPEVYAYERARGWYLLQDLGDVDLDQLARARPDGAEVGALYREAVGILVRMQTEATAGFEPARTHNPPRYDAPFMREWESGYFLRELLGRRLGMAPPAGLEEELAALAALAARAGTEFFLHRDFQSRNLKVHAGRLWVIDFQGARLGPPQYDLAALLLDPYADLPRPLRDELLEEYLARFCPRAAMGRERFLAIWPAVAAHRLMQALGAYCFLGLARGKAAFLAHIPAAARLLEETCGALGAGEFPALRRAAALVRARTAEGS